jgi:hypothetical protein
MDIFFEGLTILISTSCVCADVFKSTYKYDFAMAFVINQEHFKKYIQISNKYVKKS